MNNIIKPRIRLDNETEIEYKTYLKNFYFETNQPKPYNRFEFSRAYNLEDTEEVMDGINGAYVKYLEEYYKNYYNALDMQVNLTFNMSNVYTSNSIEEEVVEEKEAKPSLIKRVKDKLAERKNNKEQEELIEEEVVEEKEAKPSLIKRVKEKLAERKENKKSKEKKNKPSLIKRIKDKLVERKENKKSKEKKINFGKIFGIGLAVIGLSLIGISAAFGIAGKISLPLTISSMIIGGLATVTGSIRTIVSTYGNDEYNNDEFGFDLEDNSKESSKHKNKKQKKSKHKELDEDKEFAFDLADNEDTIEEEVVEEKEAKPSLIKRIKEKLAERKNNKEPEEEKEFVFDLEEPEEEKEFAFDLEEPEEEKEFAFDLETKKEEAIREIIKEELENTSLVVSEKQLPRVLKK